jgi:hypothetical protein
MKWVCRSQILIAYFIVIQGTWVRFRRLSVTSSEAIKFQITGTKRNSITTVMMCEDSLTECYLFAHTERFYVAVTLHYSYLRGAAFISRSEHCPPLSKSFPIHNTSVIVAYNLSYWHSQNNPQNRQIIIPNACKSLYACRRYYDIYAWC